MPTFRREEILSVNQKGWNKVAPLVYGGTALPNYGPLAETEDELRLIPDLEGKMVSKLSSIIENYQPISTPSCRLAW